MASSVILIVKRRADAQAVFPGGVPAGVRVFSERQPLEGLRATIVLLGRAVSTRTIDTARGITKSVGGVVAEVLG
jgi:hypothetical protein